MEGPEVDVHCIKAKILKLDNVLSLIAEKNDQMEVLNVNYTNLKAANFRLMSEKGSLFKDNNELIVSNAQLSASNDELQARNKELSAKDAELRDSLSFQEGRADEILAKYNRLQEDYERMVSESSDKTELIAARDVLISSNDKLLASKNELLAVKKELLVRNGELQASNGELQARNSELQVVLDKLNSSNIKLKARNNDLIASRTINEDLLASERRKLEEIQLEYNKMRTAFEKCEVELRIAKQESCKSLVNKSKLENEEQIKGGCHRNVCEEKLENAQPALENLPENVEDVFSPCSNESDDISDGEIERILHEMRMPELIEPIRSPENVEAEKVYSKETQTSFSEGTQTQNLKGAQIECSKETQTVCLKELKIGCLKETQTEAGCSKQTRTEETQTNYLGCAKTTQTDYLGSTKEVQTEMPLKTLKLTEYSKSTKFNSTKVRLCDKQTQAQKAKVTIRKAIDTLKRSKVDVTIKNGRLINYANRKLCGSITSLEKRIEKKILSKVIVYIDQNLNNANVSNSLRHMFNMERGEDVAGNRLEIEAPLKRSELDSGYTSDHEFSGKDVSTPILMETPIGSGNNSGFSGFVTRNLSGDKKERECCLNDFSVSNVENRLPNFIKQIVQNIEFPRAEIIIDRNSCSSLDFSESFIENHVQLSIPDENSLSNLEYYSESTEIDILDYLNEELCGNQIETPAIPSKNLESSKSIAAQDYSVNPEVTTEFSIHAENVSRQNPEVATEITENCELQKKENPKLQEAVHEKSTREIIISTKSSEMALENFKVKANLPAKETRNKPKIVKSKCKNECNPRRIEANSDESSSDTIIVYKCLTECTGIPRALTPFSTEETGGGEHLRPMGEKRLEDTVNFSAKLQQSVETGGVQVEHPRLTEEKRLENTVNFPVKKPKLQEFESVKLKTTSSEVQHSKSLNPLRYNPEDLLKINQRAKRKLTEDFCSESTTNIICAGSTIAPVPEVTCKKVRLDNCDNNLRLDLNEESKEDNFQRPYNLRGNRCAIPLIVKTDKGKCREITGDCERAEKLDEAVKTPEFLDKIKNLEKAILCRKQALNWDSSRRMLQHLVRFKGEEVIIKRTVESFQSVNTQNLVDYLIRFVASDCGEPEKSTCPFEPVLTITQKAMLTLLLRLEKTHKPDATETFLVECERRLLFSERDPFVVERVTRVYAAACKMKGYKKRLRKLICDGMYFMGDLVLPMIFYILTTWIQVLKINNGQLDEPLPKVLAQLVYTKTCTLPEYCLSVLKNLLQIYYKYPRERYNDNNVFQEFLEGFICNLEAKYEFALIILCKINAKSWCEQKLSLIKELITITKDKLVIAALAKLIEKINTEAKEADNKISLINTKESAS